MGRKENDWARSRGVGFRGGEFSEGVACGVEVGVGEAELLKALKKPGGAGLFAEGWRGDAEQFEMPLAELELVQM
jgi:hypothetical protein